MHLKGFPNPSIFPIDTWTIRWKIRDNIRSTKDRPIFKEGFISVLDLPERREWLLRSLEKIMNATNDLVSKEIVKTQYFTNF
jgi:hypothetical protein